MAKLLGNTLQGLSGRLGDVVGYSWNGVQCVRSRPVRVHNPRTEAQQAHRGQFRQEVQLAAQMRYALIKGLGLAARENHMTPQNLFMRMNRGAFGWGDGGLTVDYGRLVLSAGPVSPVVFEAPVLDGDNVLTVRFRKHRPGGGGGAFDSVFVFIYSPENQLGYLAAPALRRDGCVRFVVPDWMLGGGLQMWGFVQDERGRCSETQYIGHSETEDAPEPNEADTVDCVENTVMQGVVSETDGGVGVPRPSASGGAGGQPARPHTGALSLSRI